MLNRYIFHVPKEDHLVGLLHNRKNLFALLMEAKYLKRIAIVPPIHLRGSHNHGISIKTTWDKYLVLDNFQSFHPFIRLSDFGHIDFEACNVIDENIEPREVLNESNPLLIRKHNQYPNYYRLIRYFTHKNWDVQLMNLVQSTHEITKYAAIAKIRMKKYHCIHVRRGDKLTWKQCPGLDKKTQPKYLIKYLRKIIPKGENLYIMSNETKQHFFNTLKKSFNIFTFEDFPEFISLSRQDNYFLFSVENEIMNDAQTKIRTFKEKGYLSLLNYPPDGKEIFSSKLRRNWRYLLSRLNFIII